MSRNRSFDFQFFSGGRRSHCPRIERSATETESLQVISLEKYDSFPALVGLKLYGSRNSAKLLFIDSFSKCCKDNLSCILLKINGLGQVPLMQ